MATEPFDFDRVKTRPLAGRPSLVGAESFATLPAPGATSRELLESLPTLLAGEGLRALVDAIVTARGRGRSVLLGMGGHVVKAGCSPVIVDLMERGVVTGIAMPGSTAIHDLEIALCGRTSEDVEEGLPEGFYGTAEETGRVFARAAEEGAGSAGLGSAGLGSAGLGSAGLGSVGLGRALGRIILEGDSPHADVSLLAAAARLDLPATVHVALGTDTVHLHPAARGGAIGEATFTDFRIFTTVVAGLDDGVFLNVGSAVILPEVFLKAITAVRNAGHPVGGLFTANLDMLRHYRTRVNVVERPGERGVDLAGHHEIMLPLLRLLILECLEEGTS